ncbi:hypothetical protein HMPREF0492_0145 [Lactobacillus acidophilus ATCC 4796]|uniref:Uncharacterized protein n=1 Tax=Lactobacillus acidophilus (strain ATCC 700396 / NCK56 / N2 / NCFM) TaxID=272621 RepID=Q5FHY2_LACAC|nr:hypothetical protein LBA1894 [Lactobacillus acidophilus NCFM]AJP47172.1 hypothetical protein SD55_1884 [Lactobacillus acidophilus]EEJ77008.1 hypothetical protein HMPREF0492_0145 [Lactobacillus acidophilus ATCC 4796]ASN45871.1 hypothetical protein CGZ81_01140 [Lactobacillus acidophilus]ASX15741.1 hypothetical protein BGK66_09350 [Lactobacillus acidophilus]
MDKKSPVTDYPTVTRPIPFYRKKKNKTILLLNN